MKLSTEEKLQKCIEFIRNIEKDNIFIDDTTNDIYCEECDSTDGVGYIHNVPKTLRDMAWHLLADIDGI